MKSWEPDQEFEKADFPSRGSGAAKQKPQVPDDASGGANSPGDHERQGGRTAVPERHVSPPAFRRLDGGGSLTAPTPLERKPSTPSPLRPSDRRAQADTPESADLPVRLLREAAVTRPEHTLRLLRKWAWEKWPTATGSGTQSSLAPADRIRIVFETFGERIAVYVLELMSPAERARFREVLNDKRTYSRASESIGRREFMRELEQEGL